MNKKLLLILLLTCSSIAFSQKTGSFWSTNTKSNTLIAQENKLDLPTKHTYDLNIENLKTYLTNVPKRNNNQSSEIILSLPNSEGSFERFKVYENSNFAPALAARYPEIKSYFGLGIENPSAKVYFSISPLGFKSMTLSADTAAEFIEPITHDFNTYTVYKKADKKSDFTKFECTVFDNAARQIDPSTLRPNADDAMLRTFRLALSVTGEYTVYFGGTKALALAAMNNTMTRVNGVFEIDFGVRMTLIANNDDLIYTNAATDPYSDANIGTASANSNNTNGWSLQLQNNLTNTIGNAAYDVGHLFGASGGGGNAGCIGCVCVNDTASTTDKNKGSAFTSPSNNNPSGDTFDIDYVAHEFGHQFGANHTFSHANEGTGANMEPGSGSTIMGYAGITSQDVQPNSDAYFHAISIQQVTNNIKTKTCQTNTPTGNAIPVVNAGLNYTIPKSTPFVLTGSATDANGDVLNYNWEQFDNAASGATGASSAASATRTTGPTFRSYNSSTSPIRYFPRMQSILTGATTTSGTEIIVEALPSVARTMNFRLTVRDNRAGGPANNSDDMVVTVNATAGPFLVTSPNTVVSYPALSSQTITWDVAGTTANDVNCANVDILISTNSGTTWTTLLTGTPNDGSENVTIPNNVGTTNRIMVRGTNHIFFDVSNTNFTISTASSDTTPPTAPIVLASGTTATSTNLSWTTSTDNVAVTGYNVYQNGSLIGSTTTATTYNVTGLTPSTAYTFTVKAKDAAGNLSVASNTVNVTTLADTTAPTAPVLSASGTTSTTTNLSWTAATDNVAVTGYDVYQGASLIGSTTSATTYNVTGLTLSTAYTFTVKAKDAAGNLSIASNTVNVTTLGLTYCTSQGNSIAYEQIGRVQFSTIDNSSSGGNGYSDFTTISTNIIRGTSQTITITPFWTSTKYNESYAVFIDYNGNGVFTDAGETVWTKSPSQTTPVSGTFTIPAIAVLGQTRMRVSMSDGAIPTSCQTFSFGQVEDYTIVFVADTAAPSAPTNLTASGTAQRTTNLTWTASTDNVGVTGYDVYRGATIIGSTTTATTFNVTGLTHSTAYTFSIKAKDAAGNNSTSSNIVNITTLTPPTTTVTSCGNYIWSVNGQTYTSTGSYTGINGSGDTEFLNLTISCASVVNLKLYIEGYYDDATHAMRPVKANQGVGISSTDVDDITIELRSTSNVLIASTTALLQTNGTAVCTYTSAPSGSFYVVVKHRNAIETWSANPVTIGSTPLNYDFSTASNKAYGNNMKQLEIGIYGFYSGDLNQDNLVDLSDYGDWEGKYLDFTFGVEPTDLNGDGLVDLSDYSIWEANYLNFIFVSSPY